MSNGERANTETRDERKVENRADVVVLALELSDEIGGCAIEDTNLRVRTDGDCQRVIRGESNQVWITLMLTVTGLELEWRARICVNSEIFARCHNRHRTSLAVGAAQNELLVHENFTTVVATVGSEHASLAANDD